MSIDDAVPCLHHAQATRPSVAARTVHSAPSQYATLPCFSLTLKLILSSQGSDWNQSIFYQDVKGNLRERRLHGTQLRETKFVQEGCLIGTNIAAVHTPSGDRVVLFFQDEGGNISYRYVAFVHRQTNGID